MSFKSHPPVLAPRCYAVQLGELPKAVVADMVWDLAQRLAGGDEATALQIWDEVRRTREIVERLRDQEPTTTPAADLAPEATRPPSPPAAASVPPPASMPLTQNSTLKTQNSTDLLPRGGLF